MNKLIDQNRTAILAASENICKILSSLTGYGFKAKQDYLKLTSNSVYSGEYLEKKVDEINAEYYAKSKACEPQLIEELDKIEAAGKLLENALEITDSELAATLQIIEASQGKLDLGTEELITDTFKGNQRALKIIRGVLQRFGKDTAILDQSIFSIDSKMVFLRANLGTMTSYPYENPMYIFDLRNNLMNLCKLVGVEMVGVQLSLGEHEKELSDVSMRKAMGLPV